ncbi:MAG: metallophosphoesterase [Clostridiaceae bacterium]|jgi:3',5'-cyclic AMP phosphodiesterase CpdA/preprotein translocase subunit SecG|nr:metallophosphoesterase [Clostridiaceae bacterium]
MTKKKRNAPLSEAEQINLILQKQQKEEAARVVLTTEEKHAVRVKRTKKALKRTAVVLVTVICVIALLTGVSALTNNANMKLAKSFQAVKKADALTPFTDPETGNTTFETDREFTVLQLTDVHIGGGFMSYKKDSSAMNAVAALITEVKPDLVIVTGDMVYPVPFFSGSLNNMIPSRLFAQTMESLGAYWTVAYGNHDTEAYSYYSREELSDYYSSDELKYCLFETGPDDVDGYGNQIINVQNSAKVITQSIVVFDSHAYTKGFYQDYDNIHPNQIEWYEREIIRLNGINKSSRGADENSMIKSLAFFHIPLVEVKDAWFERTANGDKDTANVKKIYGVAGESGNVVYCGIGEDELFETMLRLGSTQGVFSGHDHLNNFSIDYNGGSGDKYIRLTYGMSIDYLAYVGIAKKTAQRGGTVITTLPDGSFDCYGLRYVDMERID